MFRPFGCLVAACLKNLIGNLQDALCCLLWNRVALKRSRLQHVSDEFNRAVVAEAVECGRTLQSAPVDVSASAKM
jgi:hypothetical protein